MITHTLPFIFESDEKNSRANGSYFTIAFSEALIVPRTAQEIFIQVTQAEIWNTFPNIQEGINNTLTFNYNGVPYVLTVPTGAFTTEALNAQFAPQLAAYQLEGLLLLSEAVEQSKVIMTFSQPGVTYVAASSTLSSVIGFTVDVTSTANTLSFFADSIARFNVVNKLLLHTTLPVNGINTNGSGTNVIAKIPITATPGYQFIYAPYHPAKVPCPSLAGFSIQDVGFWLTDENNQPVNTAGEYWGLSLEIVYEERRRFDVS